MSKEVPEEVPEEVVPETSAEVPSADATEVARVVSALKEELARVIVGQDAVVDLLVIALLARGHGLFEGVPGLAKTLLVQSLAEATDLSFSRIQFTPDLLPSDITGTDVLEEDRSTGVRSARFIEGPVFANLLLADEINRTPPKTQAALLEAMQEGSVTAGGQTRPLPHPFLVFATQNPIEQEGTYPLPEAQLDRFMFRVKVAYPSAEEELEIVERTTAGPLPTLRPQVSPEEIVRLQERVRTVPAGAEAIKLAVALVRASRPGPDCPDFVRDYVDWGAGPRASQFLILGAKARALAGGRFAVTRADVRVLAEPVLGHRIIVNFRAQAEGVSSETVVQRLLDWVDPDPEI